MQIWPAIDLRGGKCVRLQQGDYDRETVFGDDPAAMARHWVEPGRQSTCTWSISTAPAAARPRTGPASRPSWRRSTMPCELGGGIRDEATIARLLDAGARSGS